MSGGKTALGLDNNVGALVCYLNICLPFGLIYSIIVLITDKTNKLPRFHAVQSLLLSVALIIVSIILQIFSFIVAAALQSVAISSLLGLLVFVIIIGLVLLGLFAGYKGYQAQMFKLPIIGDMADKWSN